MTLRGLVRRPSEELRGCELTFRSRVPIDLARAEDQHAAYVEALRDAGVEVTVLDPLPGYPDAPFVEDAVVVLDELVVLCRSGAVSRRGEVASILPHMPARPRLDLPEEALLDGGDVLRVGRKLYIGASRRSNTTAMSWLAGRLLDHGYHVIGIPLEGALHLKSAVTAAKPDLFLVDGAAISSRALTGAVGFQARMMVVGDERSGANVLPIGDEGPVFVAASAPETARRLESEKVDVRVLDISEFEKAEAGLTCLSVLWTE